MRKSRLPLLLVLLAGGALALDAGQAWAGAGRWTPFGPGGGFVEQVLLAPAPGDALYAVTWAGAFRSANDGVTWQACGREPFDPSWLSSSTPFVVLSPDRPDTLWASRGAFIYRSTDSCAHWTLVSQEADLLAVLPGDILFGHARGLLVRSSNGGAAWEDLTIDARPDAGILALLAADPEAPERLYAALLNEDTRLATVYRSDEGGDSWQPLTTVPGPLLPGRLTCLARAPSRPDVLYAVADATVYRSADAGATWTAGGYAQADCVQVSPLSPEVLWAVGYYTLSGSRDGGRTWSALDASLPAPHGDYSGAYKVLSVTADPRQPGVLWAGTRGSGVRRSSDEGRTWSTPGLQRGLTNLPVTVLLPDPWDPGRLYITLFGSFDAGDPPPVLRSRDGGRTWENFAPELSSPQGPLTYLAFDRHDARSLWAVGGSTLSHSTDRGKTWERIGLTPGGRLTVVDSDVLFLDGSGVSRSTDGGRTWTEVLPVNFPPDDLSPFTRISLELIVDPWQPAILYDLAYEVAHVQSHLRVYKSRDGGATWHRMIEGSSVLAVDPKRAGRLFSVKNGNVLRSLDRGVTWRRVGRLDAGVFALRMDLRVADVLYAATDQGLWWSRDAGATWKAVPAGLAPIGRNVLWDIVVDPFRPFYLYSLPAGGGIYEIDLRPSGAP